MLNSLNVVMIGILAFILALNIYSIIKLQYSQAFIRDELEKKVLDFIHTMDLTDLKEFNDLEPHIKQYYKEYLAGAIIPLIIKRLNILISTSAEYASMKNNEEQFRKQMDAFLIEFKKELENKSIDFITNVQTSTPEQAQNLKIVVNKTDEKIIDTIGSK
jgi:hypothetical protein